ncbi:TadE family protein [Halomonas dongshanensis]|uniref:Pilus assembly protein n=1 Tax=Halomonas dongshanensis TaxID=2890835 RepID=A0ABT2EJP6_9GAMM|nr:TadE family protein [Halomonas dongshanensis]MCS2610792.1 pilus assembly protein [Halomonas dongshanensis]
MPHAIKQKGIATIEFAFSFVILLALFYGIAGYAMPVLLGSSYQQVASDALREGLSWQRHRNASEADLHNYIDALIADSWIPHGWAEHCEERSRFLTINPTTGSWEVCLRHSSPDTILPPIRLMDLQFPVLPEQIAGMAMMHTREVAVIP